MVDHNVNFVLEPCVLGGLCDGRVPRTEPAVVEGAPPVPMIVRNWVIAVEARPPTARRPASPPTRAPGARDVYPDAVVKVSFSEPVTGVDARSFTLTDAAGAPVPAGSMRSARALWLVPPPRAAAAGRDVRARLAGGIADAAGNRTRRIGSWTFTIAADAEHATGNTAVPAASRSHRNRSCCLKPEAELHSAKGKHHGHL